MKLKTKPARGTRFILTLAYKGTKYTGFQTQLKNDSVQEIIEAALLQILQEKTNILCSGRTDRNVHALQQIVQFHVKTAKALTRLRHKKFLYQLNSVLPADIVALKLQELAQRHVRHDVKQKIYSYLILQTPQQQPFLADYAWCVNQPLKLRAMQQAARVLVGRHDFTTFCATDTAVKSKIRHIYKIKFSRANPAPFLSLPRDKFICLMFSGNGFLKHMIRRLVGTLVDVGLGKITAAEVAQILAAKDPCRSRQTAPAQGLFLKKVKY